MKGKVVELRATALFHKTFRESADVPWLKRLQITCPLAILSYAILLAIVILVLLSIDGLSTSSYYPMTGELDDQVLSQTTIWSSKNTKAIDNLIVYDVDDDGTDDLVFMTGAGEIIVNSPSLGLELWRKSYAGSGISLYSFAVGQVDNDPSPEIILSSSAGLICLDYQTETVQWQINYSRIVYLLTLADINSNGTDAIFFFSFRTLYRLNGYGIEVFNITIEPINNELGTLSMIIDDIDMDSTPDIILTDSGMDAVGGNPRRNGHHIWIFNCTTGRPSLITTYLGGFFCSGPTIININNDKYIAIGLNAQAGEPDVYLYSVSTEKEFTFNVFDDENQKPTNWKYVAAIPRLETEDDKLLLCTSNAITIMWSYGSSGPDWVVVGNLSTCSTSIRAQPIVCDTDSDGQNEIIIPYGRLMIYDAQSGKLKGVFYIDYRNYYKTDVLLSLGDIDGDGLIEIGYGYFGTLEGIYRIILIDSSACTITLDRAISIPPVTLYPNHERQIGFLIDNMSINRMHYFLDVSISDAFSGMFFSAEILLSNLSVNAKGDSRISIFHPSSFITGTTMYIQFGLVPTWNNAAGYKGLNVQVLSSARNITSLSFQQFYRIETDLVLGGDVIATSLTRGELQNGSWVGPNETLSISGFQVIFEGTSDVIPKWDEYLMVVGNGISYVFVNLSITQSYLVQLNVPDVGGTFIITLAIHRIYLNDTTPTQFSFSLSVDVEPPSVFSSYPNNDTWFCNRTLTCSILASDAHSGLDIVSSRFQVQLSDGTIKEWMRFEDAIVRPNDDGFLCEFGAQFDEGINHILWDLKDAVGNHLSFTQSVQVDLTNIVFSGFVPSGWLGERDVICSVDVMDDNGSGINGSSLQVSFSYSDPFSFSPWQDLIGYGHADRLTISYTFNGNEGKNNSIRFRGRDNAAINYSISQTYELWIDTEAPLIVIESPANNSVLKLSEKSIKGIVYDNSSGLNTTIPRLISIPDMTEIPVQMVITEGENKAHLFTITWNASGGSYLFYLTCDDILGNAFTYGPLAFKVNRPPSAIILNPRSGTIHENRTEVNFTAGISDPDGDVLIVRWLLDNTSLLSEEMSFMTKNITAGFHFISLVVSDGFYTVESHTEITVLEETDGDDHGDGGFRVGGIDVLWILVILIIILAGATAGVWYRRR